MSATASRTWAQRSILMVCSFTAAAGSRVWLCADSEMGEAASSTVSKRFVLVAVLSCVVEKTLCTSSDSLV